MATINFILIVLCASIITTEALGWTSNNYQRNNHRNNNAANSRRGGPSTGIIFPDAPPKTIEEEIRNAMIRNGKNNNVSDILRTLGVVLPDQDDIHSRSKKQFAAPATCEPELRTVPVEADNSIDQYFIPFCVRVKRCGGCCPTGFECTPKRVNQVPVRGAKVRRSKRSDEGLKGEYVTMHVEEHDECSCVCKVQASNCNPSIHEYSESDCKCNCKNTDELAKCAASSLPKLWDGDECRCKCKVVSHCSSGQVFSHDTCSCVSA